MTTSEDEQLRRNVARHRAATTTPKNMVTRWCCNGNAEECALCDVGELPYPWICPGGHPDTPANRREVLSLSTHRGREALKDTMKRLRARDVIQAHVGTDGQFQRPEVEICELPHQTIQEEEECDALREAAQRLREVISHPDQDGVNLDEFRALVSKRLLKIALERTEREWICCDPIDVSHALCVQGEATRTMLKALLTDDDAVFPPRSDFLDEAVRLTLGHADPEWRNNVLSTAEVRELYGKVIQHEVMNLTVDERGQPINVAELSHALLAAVMGVRDRELARNRQRLLLADERHARALQDEKLQQGFDEAREAQARREARLQALDEVAQILREENQTPYDTIALSGPMARLRKLRKETERGGK